jgi:hypothetical protein
MNLSIPPDPGLKLLVVYRTSNVALCAVAKSILQAASAEYMVRGETLLNLAGGWADSDDQSSHEVEFLVREADAQWVRKLLADVRPSSETSPRR